MSRGLLPSAEHLTSWVGLAPGNNESAGKKARTPTRETKPPRQ
ncbi:MAG: transposase [Muribaculaceae bacterium]|nr:transposase [Muribaculaceae bacterium]